jgi:hypothetical protein
MSNNILFVFEGEKAENLISNNLMQFFLNENIVVTCAYCTTIYNLYSEVFIDPDLDTFNLVKDNPKNFEVLRERKRSDFAEIYLFFDYDGHVSNANDFKLIELLSFFIEETDKGKLLISYPMVEALRHIEDLDTFEYLTFAISNFRDYKKYTTTNCINDFKHFNEYTLIKWKQLIELHLKKMNKIVNDKFEMPIKSINQLTIFGNQMGKYINPNQSVAVLSSFPIFLFDYYGPDNLNKKFVISD